MKITLLLLVLLLVAPTLPAEASPFDALRALMSCTEEPDPTPVLSELAASGALGPRLPVGSEDESCWTVLPHFEWRGARFSRLCALMPDPVIVRAYPELYWDNGTYAPFSEVWLYTDLTETALRQWATANLPTDSRFSINPIAQTGYKTALACSAWDFPLSAEAEAPQSLSHASDPH